ncbi:hypothetical protein BUALT_Bualt17G0002700 [Buddleja alternifolia]|uniref:Reverse transcriptase n=1 Tax=Buddleja alternifolia TaxID=168488 RepID=A0AAV6WDI6_9LAMI|nr:hypothetical protein BUALT_Bualt17G0002700 [Buddleja alternifolia]
MAPRRDPAAETTPPLDDQVRQLSETLRTLQNRMEESDSAVQQHAAESKQRHDSLFAMLSSLLPQSQPPCIFGVPQIHYLGYVISGDGVRVDNDKIQAILDWPVPTSVTALRGFLGLTGYYRRFVYHYATLVSPPGNIAVNGLVSAAGSGYANSILQIGDRASPCGAKSGGDIAARRSPEMAEIAMESEKVSALGFETIAGEVTAATAGADDGAEGKKPVDLTGNGLELRLGLARPNQFSLNGLGPV